MPTSKINSADVRKLDALLGGDDSRIYGKEAEGYIEDAEAAFPESDFIQSVIDYLDEHGFITEKQADALERIAERNDK